MNKTELAAVVAERAEVSKRDAEAVLDKVLEVIGEALAKGETVKLSNFGVFEPKKRAARVGTNPSSGAKINIPASKSVAFKVSKSLKEKL